MAVFWAGKEWPVVHGGCSGAADKEQTVGHWEAPEFWGGNGWGAGQGQ